MEGQPPKDESANGPATPTPTSTLPKEVTNLSRSSGVYFKVLKLRNWQQALPFALAISANSICQVKFIKDWLTRQFNETEVLMGVEHAFRETCTYIIPDDVRILY